MHKTLSRRALYELVWSKPRTELAKQFNISDVAVGKLCRQMNVPAPPPGYWAHVAAKGSGKSKYIKPPLTYTVAERIDEEHEVIGRSAGEIDPYNLEHPIPPLVECSETVEETLQRYRTIVSAIPAPKPSRSHHPIVEKLLMEDERLASKASSWSWEKPKYQSPQGRQLLAALSKLLWWWSDLGFQPSSSGTRHIRLSVSLGSSHHQPFEFNAVDSAAGAKKTDKPAFELTLDESRSRSSNKKKPSLAISSPDHETLIAAALLLVEVRERGFRDWLKWRHDHWTWQRNDALKKDSETKEADRKRREAQRQALIASRDSAFNEALAGIERAERIRNLVAVLGEKVSDEDHGGLFGTWKCWALSQADSLDIRTRPAEAVVEWLHRFHLSAPDPT